MADRFEERFGSWWNDFKYTDEKIKKYLNNPDILHTSSYSSDSDGGEDMEVVIMVQKPQPSTSFLSKRTFADRMAIDKVTNQELSKSSADKHTADADGGEEVQNKVMKLQPEMSCNIKSARKPLSIELECGGVEDETDHSELFALQDGAWRFRSGARITKEDINRTPDISERPPLYRAICILSYDTITKLVEGGADVRGPWLELIFPSGYCTPLEKALRVNEGIGLHLTKLILIKYYPKGAEAVKITKCMIKTNICREFEKFILSCSHELSLLSTHMFGQYSLIDLYRNIVDYDMIKPASIDGDGMKQIEKCYPIYYKVILPKISACRVRALQLAEFKHHPIFLRSRTDYGGIREKTVSLNYDCMLRIFDYLSNEDLTMFLSLFNKS